MTYLTIICTAPKIYKIIKKMIVNTSLLFILPVLKYSELLLHVDIGAGVIHVLLNFTSKLFFLYDGQGNFRQTTLHADK